YQMFSEDEAGREGRGALYRAIRDLPAAHERGHSTIQHPASKGWRRVDLLGSTAIASAIQEAKGGGGLSVLSGVHWDDVLGIPGIALDFTQEHKGSAVVFCRIRNGPERGKGTGKTKFNEEAGPQL